MELAQSLDRLSTKLDNLDNNNLLQLLASLDNITNKARDILNKHNVTPPPPSQPSSTPSSNSSTPPKPPTPGPASELGDLFVYSSQPLEDSLVTRVHEHLKGLKYHPNSSSPNSPEIFLYGNDPYIYNNQSSELSPNPILLSLPMAELLIAVNGALKTDYNSMLINKYRNFYCSLGPHKDDEESLDPASPISALSLGATRRFQISSNADKNDVIHTVELESRSLCTMLPGFQEKYNHAIASGRKSIKKEKGVRYSITFRRILPQSPQLAKIKESEAEKEDQGEVQSHENAETISPDTLVFGSSLTKELDSTLLSKYNKKFMVYSNSGAKIRDISNDIKSVRDKGTLDLDKITSVFLVCGGNNIGNLRKDSDIENAYRDYENLIEVTKDVFPVAKINIVSLIPRCARYRAHISNMYEMNEWLHHICDNQSIRFVDIFSHFLLKLPHIWLINKKLFDNSQLHFNRVGNSVLAKVLIGVANSPRI